jgi:hypothetical protein
MCCYVGLEFAILPIAEDLNGWMLHEFRKLYAARLLRVTRISTEYQLGSEVSRPRMKLQSQSKQKGQELTVIATPIMNVKSHCRSKLHQSSYLDNQAFRLNHRDHKQYRIL